MPWLVILLIVFAGLHFVLLLPAQIAIICGAVATAALWLLWKLKWIILGIIGLEEIFGGRDDS
ncbi:MAG TPA: hypothetical protein VKP60_18080 [Magnetospirillaceae bacterium]|nr:hypothetical protein [Magnetospirillaceae bacterium]